jgi:anti-sigma regulatory factor (Ser/Thr protein kinase)
VHEALLYRNAEHLGHVAAGFADEAAGRGEPVLVVLPAPSRALMADALARTGAELRFEDMYACGRNPSCLLGLFEDWIAEHDGPVRVIDEPVWPERSHAEVVEVLRHEALVNHVLAEDRVTMLCPYDATHLDAEALEGAELTHPLVVRNGTPHPSPSYADPLELVSGRRWPQTPGREPITELDFGGDLHALRHAVASDPLAETLGRARRADLVFVINEAATNAVKHGDGHCTTRLWQDGEAVVSEVITSSAVGDALVGRRRPDDGATGGRGLWLINQMCDLVEVRTGNGGTAVRMHLSDTA